MIHSLEPFEQKPARILFPAVLGSMEQKTYEFVDSAGDQPLKIVNVEESETDIVLENAWYILKINKTNGSIVSLQIKQDANREPLSEPIETLAAPSNILEGFVDVMLSEPAWNISPTYRKTPLEPKTYSFEGANLVETGPVRWSVAITMKMNAEEDELGQATYIRKISMYADMEGIDLENDMDFHMNEITTKLFFTIAGKPQESIAEVSYGTISRFLRPTANHDKPRWENNMQDFLTIPANDGSFCFNILNEGKYGFDNIEGNKIGITMIRGPRYPDVPGSSWVNKERSVRQKQGKGKPSVSTDQGRHIIRLRLMPRAGAWESQKNRLCCSCI